MKTQKKIKFSANAAQNEKIVLVIHQDLGGDLIYNLLYDVSLAENSCLMKLVSLSVSDFQEATPESENTINSALLILHRAL